MESEILLAGTVRPASVVHQSIYHHNLNIKPTGGHTLTVNWIWLHTPVSGILTAGFTGISSRYVGSPGQPHRPARAKPHGTQFL